MPTLTAYVANCLLGGDEFSERSDGSRIRDLVRFKCDNREFVFRQNEDVALGKIEILKGTQCASTTVEVFDVEPDDVRSVLSTLENICWLLSFACQSKIICYGHRYPTGSINERIVAVVGTAHYFRPPFSIHEADAVKKFIEQTYPTYKSLFKRRKLPVIFDYIINADATSQPSEIRLLLLFVALESLKGTYASEIGLPYTNGYYRYPSGKSIPFKVLLTNMLLSVGMRRGVKQVIDLRNEIIHSGLTRKSYASQWRMNERVQDIIREYVIRLLGYRGNYFAYSHAGTVMKKA